MKIIDMLTMLAGFAGLGLISYGAWSIYEPSGYIVGGAGLVFWSYYVAKGAA